LQFPLAQPARVAVLQAGFSLDRNAREFAPADHEMLEAWGPEAIVAPLPTALFMAEQKLQGTLRLPSLNVAVIVLTEVGGEALLESLWGASLRAVTGQRGDGGGAGMRNP
jgi:hypothetical protein